MGFKALGLTALLLGYVSAVPANAQMSKAQALSEVEAQLNQWKSEGRYEDIKLIGRHSQSVSKQVKTGKVDLQAILDDHHYNHKDGKYYGQTKPTKRPSAKVVEQAKIPATASLPIVRNASSVISSSNRPVAAYTRLEKKWSDYPLTLKYTAHLGLVFPNGNFVSCSNWDPAVLNPTVKSVGRAVEDCNVSKDRGEGKKARKFSKGERIDIKFGNLKTSGLEWGDGASTQISGAKLLMTKSGRISIGKFRSTFVSSGGNGVASTSGARPLVGTYHLDGHIITITTDAGDVHNGFIAWASGKGSNKIDHIHLNGVHFWDRSN